MESLETLKALEDRYSYESSTGVFRFKKHRYKSFIGKIVDTGWYEVKRKNHSLYYKRLSVIIDGKQEKVQAHRLAWFITYGEIAPEPLDHIEHATRKDDYLNRIENLRDGNKNRVQWGNHEKDYYCESVGVSKTKRGTYYAHISLEGSILNLGTYFKSEESASLAYQEALKIWEATKSKSEVLSLKKRLKKQVSRIPFKGVSTTRNSRYRAYSRSRDGSQKTLGTYDNAFLAACSVANYEGTKNEKD